MLEDCKLELKHLLGAISVIVRGPRLAQKLDQPSVAVTASTSHSKTIKKYVYMYMSMQLRLCAPATQITSVRILQGRPVTKIWERDEGKYVKRPPWLQNTKQHGENY